LKIKCNRRNKRGEFAGEWEIICNEELCNYVGVVEELAGHGSWMKAARNG